MVAPEPRTADHPDPGALAAYVDRALGGDERGAVERHLATCDACRDEVRALHRLVRPPLMRRPGAWVPVLAAAALAAVLLVPSGRAPDGTDVHRDAPAPAGTPLLVAPLDSAAGRVEFTWRSVAAADLYRFTLLDADGNTLHQAAAADTILLLPPDLPLTPGTPYYWKVQARIGFDRWISSPLAEFRLAEPGR